VRSTSYRHTIHMLHIAASKMHQQSWLPAKLISSSAMMLLMHMVFFPSDAAAQSAPADLGLATVNLIHTTQIYNASFGSSTATVDVATQLSTLVPFYLFTSPRQAQDDGRELPAVYFLNGFNVPAQHYSDLATLLAASGFYVAASDYRRESPFTVPGIDAACAPYINPSAATLNTLMDGQVAQDGWECGPHQCGTKTGPAHSAGKLQRHMCYLQLPATVITSSRQAAGGQAGGNLHRTPTLRILGSNAFQSGVACSSVVFWTSTRCWLD
jgi:hypothetical protein